MEEVITTQVKKPILSICIPTYNRSKYLKRCLDSVTSQEEFQNGMVEVVICDNASEDDTEELVRKYTEEFQNISYVRNSENMGNRHFAKVLGMGKGKLRRLCNDTLIFVPGSLGYICKTIERFSLERPYLFWSNSQLNREDEFVKTDFHDFVTTASFLMTSSACFSIWDDECHNIETDIAGSELLLWQVRKGLNLAYGKDRIVICNRELTTTQSVEKKDISYGLYQVFFINYFELLEPYFKCGILKECDREYLEKDLLFHFFMYWCIEWELSSQSLQFSEKENLRRLIENQYKDKPYWSGYLRRYNIRKMKRRTKKCIWSAAKKILNR